MSLGVLFNISATYAENNLNQTQSSLQNTLTQLSSGSRINTGSDDAAGLSVVDGLQANVSALTQSAQNATDGIGQLQTADGALSQVTDLLNRAVTLSTEAANGTLNTNQVGAANQEYQNILSEIANIGATTNFNGNAVFTSTAKSVFVSDGTASGATTISSSVGALNDSDVGITAATNAAATAVAAGAITGTAVNGGTTAAAFVNASTGSAGTYVATSTLTAANASDSFSAGAYTVTYAGVATTVNVTQGQTLAQVRADFSTQLAQAGSGFSGVTVGTASTTAFTLTGAAGAANTLTVAAGSQQVYDQTATGGTAQSTTLTFNNASDVVSGNIVLTTGATPTTFTATTGETATQLAAAINGTAGYTATFGTGSNANVLTITGAKGTGNGLTAASNLVDNTLASSQSSGVNFTGAAVSTLTAATAQTVLTTVTTAIADVAYQRGEVGANVNELTAAANVASSESVNLTSAQSSIQSTDYGAATSDLAKYQVLIQTGISALAQANSVQQEVLKLLQ